MTNHQYSQNKVISKRINGQLDSYIEKHSKILAVRFDARYPVDHMASGDNKDISSMTAKLSQKYKRQGLDPVYLWKREEGESHNPHYHVYILLDGQKVRSFNHVFNNAEKLWKSTIGVNQPGLINHCTKSKNGTAHENGILIVRSAPDAQQKVDAVRNQLSYLAKEAQSAEPKDGLRDFGMSRSEKKNK